MRRKNHYSHRRSGVDEGSEVHLTQRHHEPRVNRQQQKEIQLACANELGKVRAINEKECLEHLLNKMTGANQDDHLPLGPGADVVRVQVQDANKTQLQTKPQQLDKNPQKKIGFE